MHFICVCARLGVFLPMRLCVPVDDVCDFSVCVFVYPSKEVH